VSQSLGAHNQYPTPNLRNSWSCNNIWLISLKNMSNSWRIMNNFAKWLWTWDHRWVVHERSIFGRMVPGTTNLLLLLLQCRYCFSLIFIWTYKIIMNICILYYSSLFLQFYFLKKYFFIITNGVTDGLNPLVYFRELENIYCICQYHRWKFFSILRLDILYYHLKNK
jgi:hypothetical protein